MTHISRLLTLFLIVVVLGACDTVGERETRNYAITYEAVTDHEDCTVTYMNPSQEVSQVDVPFGGDSWSESFDVSVQGAEAFVASLTVSCANADGPSHAVLGTIIVNDEPVREVEVEGTSVSIDLAVRLTVDGIQEF